jgi:hypothetical protein
MGLRGMKFQLQLPSGSYTTQDGAVRKLDHPFGPIHIIDQLFESSFVESLHAVASKIPFTASDYDTEANRDTLHLKCELPVGPLMSGAVDNKELLALLPKGKGALHLSAVARITAQALEELYPDYSSISIGRIHVNCLPYGDLLRTHEDGWPGAALTGLYFANASWHTDWQGELIICDPLRESLYAIEPRPGRIVLFPGETPHRAGAPSRACYAHRLTVAHKFLATRRTSG